MKQLEKQSLKELIKFALEMPVGDLAQYGTLFLSGPIPEKMTRGELIALQLIQRASYGDLDAVKEIRQWVVEDPKTAPIGGDTYYQFLINTAEADKEKKVLERLPLEGLKNLASAIEAKARVIPPSELLEDL